ncbi:glycine receptor subunit alpha-4 isoform X2 [Eurytemora carolleeae]|uniref:glycine receptor subunit alpha-4 isoform X2 n=1 Tax=Eurytemora carolleeae TaxID=1294199 RepID=UPI000C76BAEF|nr:glycine receptor subunit alpha-4 isoform X2 [Eurytemora carolleeae]|eukprot:XP_023344150.1 glycine receptor subunit alpha-4-like isoform X2 [Eurytemora affinis]
MYKYNALCLITTILVPLCESAEHFQNLSFGILDIKSPDVVQLNVSPNYNLHERPYSKGPLKITASINLRNILDVDEKAQIVSLETTLRLYWKDPRISPKAEYLESFDSMGNYTTLNPSLASKIWMPDIFIDQAKVLRAPSYFIQPASLRVYNDSLIRYSSRINFDVACNMDFHRYPVDEQYCEIKFESFGLQSNQIQLGWIPNSMDVNQNITLAQFHFRVKLMDSYSTDYYDVSYPGLILQLHLTRVIGYHIVQTYIPSTVFVVLAWMGMFIPVESVPGRVGMGMTTMLTLTAMFSSTRQNVPKVSYISVLDIWMLICMIFVFSTMAEFTVVIVLVRQGKKEFSEQFQMVSRFMLPCFFLLVNLLYWPLIMHNYLDGE